MKIIENVTHRLSLPWLVDYLGLQGQLSSYELMHNGVDSILDNHKDNIIPYLGLQGQLSSYELMQNGVDSILDNHKDNIIPYLGLMRRR